MEANDRLFGQPRRGADRSHAQIIHGSPDRRLPVDGKHGCTEEVCRAGMFHSIYGTELFQGFKLPVDRRSEIRDLIGDRAERLAYLNCAMDRASFDRALECGQAPYQIVDRLTGEGVHLNQADFDDLCRVHLYDFLEQVARAQRWDYRRSAYRRMAERLGVDATGAYDMVFTIGVEKSLPR